MGGMAGQADRTTQTGAYLHMLLSRPGPYRQRWAALATDPRAGQIDQAAVAGVLSGDTDQSHDDIDRGHGAGWSVPAATVAGRVTPGDLATVRDALSGVALTRDTLERFIDRFGFTARHAGQLRDVLAGSPATRVITGDVLTPPELYRRSGPPGYDTLALHEVHTLGPDGTPAEHQTIQVIRSTVDRLESCPYRFDTDRLTVEVTRGGRIGDQVYQVSDGLYGVDIVPHRPLERGQVTLLQIRTTFCYDTPPPPEFRRGLLRPTREVSLWVRFHPDRLPARVVAARWDGLDHARVIEHEPADLDGEYSVHRRYDEVSRAVVGFTWTWS